MEVPQLSSSNALITISCKWQCYCRNREGSESMVAIFNFLFVSCRTLCFLYPCKLARETGIDKLKWNWNLLSPFQIRCYRSYHSKESCDERGDRWTTRRFWVQGGAGQDARQPLLEESGKQENGKKKKYNAYFRNIICDRGSFQMYRKHPVSQQQFICLLFHVEFAPTEVAWVRHVILNCRIL